MDFYTFHQAVKLEDRRIYTGPRGGKYFIKKREDGTIRKVYVSQRL